MTRANCVHIDLDGAWANDAAHSAASIPYVDCRSWGPGLRYSSPVRGIEEFSRFVEDKLAPFTLFGSGDFHHLTALWLRRIQEPFVLVSFDNHPDWDIRPPKWCCGTWINRALELPMLRQAVIWGCGNFELNFPGYLFVNGKALREKRLEVWPWKERLKRSGLKRWHGITRETWKDSFTSFARQIAGQKVYVTVDLDCLTSEESTTNWENGLFASDDIVWALGELRRQSEIIGGDLCGAWSKPAYARWRQRIEAELDHPKAAVAHDAASSARNQRSCEVIWTEMTKAT